jgi:hypothetical protein
LLLDIGDSFAKKVMTDKIAFHLSSLIEELKIALAEQIENSLRRPVNNCPVDSFGQHNCLMTTDEIAAIFKISKSHINKLRKKYPDFPVLNIEGSVRFDSKEVTQFFHTLSSRSESFET